MTIVIPMAGMGSRFKNEGYSIPKYMIKIKGKTLFERSMKGLPLNIAEKIVFICLESHNKFEVDKFIKNHISHKNIKILKINETTRGQAETVFKAEHLIDDEDEMLIYNIDTEFYSKDLSDILKNRSSDIDGILGAFINKSKDNKWSFASINENGIVIKTTEKEKISDYALTGLYHFRKANIFFKIAKKWIEEDKKVEGEFYIAPMYNDLIEVGGKFILNMVDSFIPLGTPQEVIRFEQES